MEVAHAHKTYKGIPTDFSVKKLDSHTYGIDVTTTGNHRGIPAHVQIVVNTKQKVVTINGQPVAMYLGLYKKDKTQGRRRSKRKSVRKIPRRKKETVSVVKVKPPSIIVPPGRRRLIVVDDEDTEAIQKLLPKVESSIFEDAKGLLGMAATGAGWMVWAIQQSISYLYWEVLVYLGPFTFPLIGIAINLLLPDSAYSSAVESASMWVFTFMNQPKTMIMKMVLPGVVNAVIGRFSWAFEKLIATYGGSLGAFINVDTIRQFFEYLKWTDVSNVVYESIKYQVIAK